MDDMSSLNNKNNLNLNNLLFDPNSFFGGKLKYNVDFKYPILIILVNAVFSISSSLLLMNKLKDLFPSDINSFMSTTVISVTVVGGFIGAFLSWVILAGILYSISYLFHSNGSFKRTLEFVGYGYVPKIVGSFINFVVTYKLLSSVDFSSQNSQLITQSMEQMFSNNPLFYTSQIITILCLLLSTYIWIFALLNARNMSLKNATLAVGIPAGLVIIFQVYSLLFTLQ